MKWILIKNVDDLKSYRRKRELYGIKINNPIVIAEATSSNTKYPEFPFFVGGSTATSEFITAAILKEMNHQLIDNLKNT